MANRSAIITGGAGGQGSATARELSRAGWNVAVFDIDEARMAKLAEDTIGMTVTCHRIDVTDYDALKSGVESVVASIGYLDAVLICAGVHDRAPIAEGDPSVWQHVVDVNFLGVLKTLRACLPHLLTREYADIVVWGSISGFVPYSNESVYAASKAADIHLMDCLRQETAQTGVRLSIIHPGMVNSAMTWANASAMAQQEFFDFLEPEDLARVARFIVDQPANTCISEIVVRPARQAF
jgi:NADP-dependent 3-hydroxy acid dehydrogenase YdfG